VQTWTCQSNVGSHTPEFVSSRCVAASSKWFWTCPNLWGEASISHHIPQEGSETDYKAIMSWRKYKCGSVWSEVSFRKQIALAFFSICFAAHCSRVVWSARFYRSALEIFVNKSDESSRRKACSLSHSKYIFIFKSCGWNCLISELAGLLRSCLICSGRRSQRISASYIYIAVFVYLSFLPIPSWLLKTKQHCLLMRIKVDEALLRTVSSSYMKYTCKQWIRIQFGHFLKKMWVVHKSTIVDEVMLVAWLFWVFLTCCQAGNKVVWARRLLPVPIIKRY